MRPWLALLKDRRRAQRGSVLSGVLIMTAFIAIIVGALMTELSTSFLLSRAESARLANQATINSALESSMNQLSTTPIGSGCPSLSAITLNGRWAVPFYTGCWPAVRENPGYAVLANTVGDFTADGTHALVTTTTGQTFDLYLTGNSAGQLYEYDFGSSASRALSVPGGLTGPPRAAADTTCQNCNSISLLVPISVRINPPSGCQSGYCVAYIVGDGLFAPEGQCYLGANAAVTARPAASVANSGVYFFGDQMGNLYAYAASETGCTLLARSSTPGGRAIVAGPVVFSNPNQSSTDEVYVVSSDGFNNSLVRFEFRGKVSPPLRWLASRTLPNGQAVGMALDGATLPARAAVTFADGTVALAQIRTDFSMPQYISTSLGAGIARAPAWCCSAGRIGVALSNALTVLDTSLNLIASYPVSTTIGGSPVADAAGDWFFGADDSNIYEVPAIATTPTVLKLGSAALGRIQSSVVIGNCPAGMCIFASSRNESIYKIPLDTRQALITACIAPSASSPCSGARPVLRAQIQVGSSTSKNSVHIQGWAYYSG